MMVINNNKMTRFHMIKSHKTIGSRVDQHGFDTMFNQEFTSMFLKTDQEILMFDPFYEIESQHINSVVTMRIKHEFSKTVGKVKMNLSRLEVELV